MTLFDLVFLILAGLTMGSFTTALIYRLPRGLPYSHDPQGRPVRSICPPCGRVLRARELIPVLSWVYQRGRCACGKIVIPLRYPMTEILVLALTLVVGYRHGVDLVDAPRFAALPFAAATFAIGAMNLGGWPRSIDRLLILLASMTAASDIVFTDKDIITACVPLFFTLPLIGRGIRGVSNRQIWHFLSLLPLIGFLA